MCIRDSSDTQALDENFSVLVGLKSLVVAVSTCHTEGEALNFSVRGSLDDFERAFLRLIDKTNACFVLYGINTVHQVFCLSEAVFIGYSVLVHRQAAKGSAVEVELHALSLIHILLFISDI